MSLATNISVVGNTVHVHPQPGSTINITVTPTSPGSLRFTLEFPTNSIHQWRSSIDANDSVVPDSEVARLEELERFNAQEFVKSAFISRRQHQSSISAVHSPVVVAPETIDLDPPGDALRRGLALIAKIIQNLTNNIFFGKEAHMMVLNDFLRDHIAHVTRYLSELNWYTPGKDDEEEWLGTASDGTDIIVLHRFFDKHADKVGQELLSISKSSADGDNSAISRKRAWDGSVHFWWILALRWRFQKLLSWTGKITGITRNS
ncbi:hypothetical protein BT96DRAFT_1004653 [Gymnopus androsaceus JB14]|uniref:Uncharacterized protein n=1 Tax=Gymnopus androsaceus JB14 TaxID=1447944 RepID=A0A6A4GR72_9AGAR|nr:hypothetical protein BT96DRAFT_1004653 [Gymnopus androsaceus JB14]